MASALNRTLDFFAFREPEPVDEDFMDSWEEPKLQEPEETTDFSLSSPSPVAEFPRVVQGGAGEFQRIVTFHPTSYADAPEIAKAFRGGIPVIMNLGNMREEEARRLVDFGAGLVEGLRGHYERVTTRVFLLTPHDVAVEDGTISRGKGSLDF
ncbi:MAG: cell division protein SepF [Actinomycetaceae bacterium]|nr:cell division protein SepF [Actinomycetaceae bacterium]